MWDVDEEDPPECVDRGEKLRHTAGSSVSSSLSMKSDRSKHLPLNFSTEPGPSDTNSDSGFPSSCVSMKSDCSKEELLTFKCGAGSADEGVSQQSSQLLPGGSAPQHQRHLDSTFMLLEDNMVTFMKKELKQMKKLLSPDYPACSESEREDEDEEQRSSRESFLRITLDFLRRMKQEELAERLWSSKRI